MLLFSLLMIMLSQFLAFVFAYPIGYCEKSEHEDDCGDKANIYDETVAWLTDRDEVQARACFWEPFPDVGAAHCQPILPDPQDIARSARRSFLDRFMTLVSPEDLARARPPRVARLSKFKHAVLRTSLDIKEQKKSARGDPFAGAPPAAEEETKETKAPDEPRETKAPDEPALRRRRTSPYPRAKILGTLGFLAALLLPMWWLLIIARKYNGAGSAGRKIKRICYFSTMFWIFYHNFVVEPFAILILKLFVPASLHGKISFFEDPAPLARVGVAVPLRLRAAAHATPLSKDQRAASRLVRKKLPQTPGADAGGRRAVHARRRGGRGDAFVEEHDVARDARADDDFRAIEGVEAPGAARGSSRTTRGGGRFYHAAVVTFGTTMVFMWPSPADAASGVGAPRAPPRRASLALDDLKAEVVPPESLARTSPLRVNSSYFSRAEETYAVAATANRAAGPVAACPSVFRARAARLIRTMSTKVARVAPVASPPPASRSLGAPARVRLRRASAEAVEAIALEVRETLHSYASRGDLHSRALDVYEHLDRLEDHDGEAAAAAKAGGGKFDKMKVRFIASVKQQMKLGAREIRRSMMS
ncbi:hypothetical protein SO694_00053286 [Aureococcus anophagefferens]|uniref:RGS domain-containing protein n=1 Tax=Aureococcus anophagefferens TaxID=44056 RepID=A0ABR1FY41_AURAN